MNRLVVGCCVLLSAVAFAESDGAFDRLKQGSKALAGLGPFLEKYIGECQEAPPGSDCKANAAAFRREAGGQRYFLIIGEDSVNLSAGSADDAHNTATVAVTPFFPASSYALTQGAPKKTDANGNPVMPLVYVKIHPPDGMSASSVSRMISMRALRLEVIFSPQDVWTLPKKPTGRVYGVRAKVDALRISVGRTGESLGTWTNG